MQLQHNVSLKPYNTFGIDTTAEYFLPLTDESLLHDVLLDKSLPEQKHILGGGSNVLLTQSVNGLTVLNRIKGIRIVKEDDEHVWLKVNGGEVWHELVMYAIQNGWGGIENLALIPGTVGASPIQNIGAYGVEAKETIETVNGYHLLDNAAVTFTNADCRFGYRDSIFKNELKHKVFISSVVFRLDKKPKFNTSYGAITQELEKMNITELSVRAIANAVIAIRTSKLPDPKQIGNAGSFFKNPTINKDQYNKLQESYPDIPSYPVSETTLKIPAGWLIESCGWKGIRKGDTGIHAKQALVLVNYGNATGSEIWALSEEVVQSVKNKFGIELEREVQVW